MKKCLLCACLALGSSFGFASTPFLSVRKGSASPSKICTILQMPSPQSSVEDEAEVESGSVGGDELVNDETILFFRQIYRETFGAPFNPENGIRTRSIPLEDVTDPSILRKSIKRLRNCVEILDSFHAVLDSSLSMLSEDSPIVRVFRDKMQIVSNAIEDLNDYAVDALKILNNFRERKEEWEGFSLGGFLDEFTEVTSDLLRYCREHVQDIEGEVYEKIVPILQNVTGVASIIRFVISLKTIIDDSSFCCPCLLI